MHRPTIALLAIVLLAVGVFTRGQTDDTISGACLRVAAVMTVLWLAEPQLRTIPRWFTIAAGVALFVAMLRPKLLVVAIPFLALLWLLRRRPPRTS